MLFLKNTDAWGITTYSLEWLKLKKILPSVGKVVEQMDLSHTAGGNGNGISLSEKNMAVSIKVNTDSLHDPAISLLEK